MERMDTTMSILKCKMCGGDLEISNGMSVCECEYCGTRQTIPKVNDEQKINAMNRANHFRRQCEFDKAIEVYEKILQNSGEDAELYWTLALCKYGIEYVDDPMTNKKVPTCHRMQYTSILDDVDYKEALERADELQKSVYKKEAEAIAAIQKSILDISNKEEPFDVFICYKESDDMGARTQDSVLAQDIYFGLTEKGFKVFFSRITLEGKLGTAYEPYIFAALNSAKVMIVVGTKPEYINAVWVKNEWSRFLMLMQKDKHKLIIPAYRGMDPYDLPDALSVYQSQDMAKLGFMQDLIRGVTKVLESDKEKEVKQETQVVVSSETNANIIALIKRGNLALEDGEWERAFDFFDQVLNSDAENSEAYLGQLLSKNKAANVDEFVSVLLEKTSVAEPTVHSIQVSPEQFAQVNNILKEHAITIINYTKEELQKYEYVTYAESRTAQKEEILSFFENDKLLKKAVRFAKDNGSGVVEQLKNGVLPVMDSRIAEAIEADKIAESETEKTVAEVYQGLIDRVHKIIDAKAAKYEKLVADYKSGQTKISCDQLKRTFLSFGEYKDAISYANSIDISISETEEKIKALQDEKRTIMNSFMDLGFFSGKKRRELEFKLKAVNDEIEKLEEDIRANNIK